MSYPRWPEELKRFERPGWVGQRQNARRRTDPENGPPSMRRRFSSVARRQDLSLVVTVNERAIFDRFYEDTCLEGSGLFWMPDPSRHGLGLLTNDGVQLLTQDGKPLLISAWWLCLFGEEPPVETVRNHVEYQKSFSVWVMPP